MAFPCLLAASVLTACGSDVVDDSQSRVAPTTVSSSSASSGTSVTGTGAGPTSSSTGIGAGGSSQGGGGAGGAPEGIISLSDQSLLEAETHIALAPNNVVVIAWIAESPGGISSNGYVFSKSGGDSWEPVAHLDSPGGRVASDPVLAVDTQGNIYMTWIGFRFDAAGNAFDMHVYAAVAPSGTTMFGAPIEVSTPSGGEQYDKPWITVTSANAVLLTYARTSTGGILAARSVDQGQTWTNAVIVEDGGFRNLVYPCVEPQTGRVFVTYHAGGGIGLRWSDDDGATWPDANKNSVSDMNDPPPAFEDPTCVAVGSEVWVSYGLSNDGFGDETTTAKLYTIKVAHSPDSGVSVDWRAAADDPMAGKFTMLPQLAREAGGAFDLVYYAGNQDGDAAASYRHARSTDGQTWGASEALKTPIQFLQSRASPQWLGDYVGMAVSNGTLYTSYTDNTLDYSHVAFAKVVLPP